jgi:hypothetical protein
MGVSRVGGCGVSCLVGCTEHAVAMTAKNTDARQILDTIPICPSLTVDFVFS